ncbi:MAG TPA: MJ0042-type zinc finger domain-containing protein [Polyangiaceae bacterium]|nr:MJ0042-type zinc finger domain-containing protein [Polyangiaceae bacterium]
MAFAVVCKSCQSRFLLNDDLLRRRVAGRVVTVRCRQCHATIEVDASNVDGAQPNEPEPEAVTAPAAPVAPRPMTLKATPAPPRPAKSSTLMGIGSPARPAGSTELIALSPGLLDVRKEAPAPAHGFPEPPPPPPASIEILDADDWEISETPPLPKQEAAPESLDDFVEELPPSLPLPPNGSLAGDDEPTRMIPSKALLEASKAHAEATSKLTTASAPAKAPSAPAKAPSPAVKAPHVDLTHSDVPLTGKNTLPLFGLDDDQTSNYVAPSPPARPKPPQPAPSPPEGSLSPASIDPPVISERTDSVRSRRNVVAPSAKSDPPAPGQRRSSLAIPIVLVLAVAAGVLIWKRGAVSSPAASEPREPAALAEKPAPLEKPEALAATAPPAAPTAKSAEPAADDVTFETTPAPKVATTHREPASSGSGTSEAKPQPSKPEPTKTATPSEPEPAVAKTEPKAPPSEPATPSGPVGDFDPATAAAALTAGAAQASSCRKDGDPSGVASVVITFAPSGRVTSANISGPPYAGTPTGGCIAAALRRVRVPAFDGDRVTVSKTIVIQ